MMCQLQPTAACQNGKVEEESMPENEAELGSQNKTCEEGEAGRQRRTPHTSICFTVFRCGKRKRTVCTSCKGAHSSKAAWEGPRKRHQVQLLSQGPVMLKAGVPSRRRMAASGNERLSLWVYNWAAIMNKEHSEETG